MALVQIVRSVLACDGEGCGETFGGAVGLVSPVEARAQAYAAGWRFPNHAGKNGNFLSTSSDVCPRCAPSWQPQPRRAVARVAKRSELLAMEERAADPRKAAST